MKKIKRNKLIKPPKENTETFQENNISSIPTHKTSQNLIKKRKSSTIPKNPIHLIVVRQNFFAINRAFFRIKKQ